MYATQNLGIDENAMLFVVIAALAERKTNVAGIRAEPPPQDGVERRGGRLLDTHQGVPPSASEQEISDVKMFQ
ncbi:MAG: hypothetical protein GTO26_11670 [Planctomycetales bacterium]|nr:hypothetical protein [Planctomycetales bacterium]